MINLFKMISVLVVTSLAVGSAWYTATANICPVPLTYKIGKIDQKFNLDQAEAMKRVQSAEKVWEEQMGRELFAYDEAGVLVIDFVYDERQEGTNAERTKQRALEEKRIQMNTLQEEIDSLQDEFNEKSSDYEGQTQSYETRLATYNEKVARYNDQGGAPKEVFEALEAERRALDTKAVELGDDAKTLNKLADTINELGQKSNLFVDEYNREVEAYNKEFGFSKEFTQGDYFDDRINIYEFANQGELEAVLVHELGHALGLEHVDDRSSVMYYLLENSSSSPVLSAADKQAFVALCGDGHEVTHKIRSFIRKVLI
jgi:DNA repair exonuclease SbcCD ATPase subunit